MTNVKVKAEQLNYECNEAYKTLRTNLQFCGEDKKTVVFTSCMASEGKSTVVLYLAISLAEAGKKVLIIDGDLRKSVMTGHFEIEGEVKGMTHLLSGQVSNEEAICHTDCEGLDIIFSGPAAPNPAELLGGQLFKDLLRYGRERYDYVLVDSAPLGLVIDSAIIADECDGSVIVIEAETISYRYVQEIKAQLEKSNCSILGVILNKIDLRDVKYYNRYYGRRYGHRYGGKYGYGRYEYGYGEKK